MKILRLKWAVITFFSIIVVIISYLFLNKLWQPGYAQRWIVISSFVLSYELWLLWRNLRKNYKQGENTLLSKLGAGTIVTLFRGLLIAMAAGFLFSPKPTEWLGWVPGIFYGFAAIADGFDGYLARIKNHVTVLGVNLDLEYDALGLFLMPLLAILYGQLPICYLVVSISRYLFIFNIWILKRIGRPTFELTPSSRRRYLAGFQMGLVSVVLFPILKPPVTTIAAVLFMTPLMACFLRDWLVVSGFVRPESKRYVDLKKMIVTIGDIWLPFVSRIIVVVLAAKLISQKVSALNVFAVEMTFGEISIFIFLVLMTSLGVAGRLMALLLALVVGLNISVMGFHLCKAVLFGAAITILLMGSGYFSLWQPEEKILIRQGGGN